MDEDKRAIVEKYGESILNFFKILKETNLEEFEISIKGQKITTEAMPEAPESWRIWYEDSKLIKAFNCDIAKIYIYSSFRDEQGYMIYGSLNHPQNVRLELNFSKMIKKSGHDLIEFVYLPTYALGDGRDRNIERKYKTIDACRSNGLSIRNERIYLGTFSLDENKFEDITPEDFIKNLVKLILIKGHFSGILRISSLPIVSRDIEEISSDALIIGEQQKFTEIQSKNLYASIESEIREIRSFLNGDSIAVGNEKLCFWVWFCYVLGLHKEAALIFRKIDEIEIEALPANFYNRIKQIGLYCERKEGS